MIELPDTTTIASIAPSFPAYFDCHPLQLVTALKMAGFNFVEETAVVLPDILELRQHYLARSGAPLLGESCPRINHMIAEDYPHLTQYIPPVPSPMELHGQKLKDKYGTDCYTVFISPCEYKKQENAVKKAMDQVVTFGELRTWLDEKVDRPLHSLKKTEFDSTIDQKAARLGVLVLGIHGASACEAFLQNFPSLENSSYTEMLYCDGGCLRGARQMEYPNETATKRILRVWEDY